MEYGDFRRNWDAARDPVLALVRRVDAGETGIEASELPFSERVRAVWLANTLKLRGVKRINGLPYATHPTRMALICHWVIADAKVREDAAVLALLHDYLEEGDGMTTDGLDAMRRAFPAEPDAVLAAVVLSEPVIDYVSLGRASELSFWKRVAYVIQAEEALRVGGRQAFADAALADKLDNLHDLGYLKGDVSKLAHRLGYFAFVGRHLSSFATPELSNLLEEGVRRRSTELGVPADLVEAAFADLDERLRGQGTLISRMTREYQSSLGLRR